MKAPIKVWNISFFKIFLLVTLGHGFATESYAQIQFNFRHLGTSDGLSQTGVIDIIEDYQGFFWFATHDGLNRYDGSDFSIYREALDVDINFYHILSLAEDKDSTLWVGTRFGGLSCYDRVADRFYQYVDKHGHSLRRKSVHQILDMGQHQLLIVYGDGKLVLLDKLKQEFDWFVLDQHPKLKEITTIALHQDQLWIGTAQGQLWQMQHHEREGFMLIDKLDAKSHINDLCSHQDQLWVSTNDGLLNLEAQAKQLNLLPELNQKLNTRMIKDVAVVDKNNVWIGTSIHGAFRYNPSTRELTAFKENNIHQQISDDGILKIYCDDQSNVWVGTFAGGVNLFAKKNYRFNHYILVDAALQSHKGNNVSDFALSRQGGIWIVNGGELSFLHNGTISDYDHSTDSLGITNKRIQKIFEDSQERLWILPRNEGTLLYQPGAGKGSIHKFPDIKAQYFHESKDGEVLIAHDEGLILISKELQMLELADRNPVLRTKINVVINDVNGDILVGTGTEGVFRYDKNQDLLYPVSVNNTDQTINTQDLLLDSQGRLWLAALGSGLFLYDRKLDSFQPVVTEELLPSKMIKSIEEDELGRIWFGSNKGLSCYDPTNNQLLSYSTDEGLQGDEFIARSSIQAPDGQLYFGGYNGFNSFDPDEFGQDEASHHAKVSAISFISPDTQDVEYVRDRHGIIQHMEVPYYLNHFTVSLTESSFYLKEKPSFWYQLKGYRNDWIKVNDDNKVTLFNLAPGDYELFVDTDEITGQRSPTKVLAFTVHAPFWRTIWAYLCYAAILIALVWLFRKKTLANERLRADLQIKEIEARKIKELNALKSTFFTNVSHEFRTPITLLMGPLENLIEAEKSNSQLVQRYRLMYKNAKVLLRLINQILDLSKIEFGHMPLQVSRGNIVEHIREVFTSFEYLSDTHTIHYAFEANYQNMTAYFDADKIEKICYNLLYNAFKFTPDEGEIHLLINLVPDQHQPGHAHRMVMTIRDNGIGIRKEDIDLIFSSFYQGNSFSKREQLGTGLGLSLTKQLVELHKGSIKVESQEGEGSIFTVSLPLSREVYPDELILESRKNVDRYLSRGYEETTIMPTEANTYFESYEQILVIDDNQDILDYLSVELGNHYRIEQATDGETGFQLAIQKIPDLIIADVMMPGIDGFTLCKNLKSDPRTSHIPVIIISALVDPDSKIEGLRLGVDDYITKPFNMAILKQRIENIISNRAQYRDMLNKDAQALKKLKYKDAFIQQVSEIIEKNSGNTNLTVEMLADILKISTVQLYRKTKGAIHKSPNEFIRFIRLNMAAQKLILEHDKTIAEVAFEVGFNDPAYFSRCFKKQFDISPSSFQQKSSNTLQGTRTSTDM